MQQPIPFPVTEENMPQCWSALDRLRRKSRRMAAIARTGGLISNLILLFSLLYAANGLIYSNFNGPYHGFLDTIPMFSDLWTEIYAALIQPGTDLNTQILLLILACYALSIALFIVLALLLALVYHPRTKKLPEGTYAEQAELFAKAAQEAWSASFKTKLSASPLCAMLVILTCLILVLSYTFSLQDPLAIIALTSTYPTQSLEVNCIVYMLATYLVCSIFSNLLLLITRFIYRYRFPYDWMAQAETAALKAKDELPDPEALRNEAIELEKEAAYAKAKNMFHNAALLGDVPAMVHFARHCLLNHLNDSARYWLKKAIASGQADAAAKKMLLRLRLHMDHRLDYLRPDAAPLTKGQKVWHVIKTVLTVFFKILILLLFVASVAVMVLLLTDNLDITAFTEGLSQLFS